MYIGLAAAGGPNNRLMAGLAAFGGFLFMALLARRSMRDQAANEDSLDDQAGSSTSAW